MWAAMVLVAASLLDLAAQQPTVLPDTRQRDRMAQGQRIEGQAMLALADAAMAGNRPPAPSELRIRWQNAFLKAQQGTFVPFTLAIEAAGVPPAAALVYIRAVVKPSYSVSPVPLSARSPAARRGRKPVDPGYPVDAIFPVELDTDGSRVATVSRGFSVEPGEYDVYVVVRERPGAVQTRGAPRAGILVQTLSVPDYRGPGLSASSVMLADRLTLLPGPLTDDELVERPYVIGQHEIRPAADDRFRRDEELVVVLLLYNPMVTVEKHFDVEVEYHFFRRAAGPAPVAEASAPHPPEQAGERYFNHTDPQRFNRAMMGAQYDPTTGRPVLAGQGIPLAGFELGIYRLAIRVTDRLSGKVVTRDLSFTIES